MLPKRELKKHIRGETKNVGKAHTYLHTSVSEAMVCFHNPASIYLGEAPEGVGLLYIYAPVISTQIPPCAVSRIFTVLSPLGRQPFEPLGGGGRDL